MKTTVRFHCELCKTNIGGKLIQDILSRTHDSSHLVCTVDEDVVVVNSSFETHSLGLETKDNNREIVIVNYDHLGSACTTNKNQTFIVHVKIPNYHFITLHMDQNYMLLLDSFLCTSGLEMYPDLEFELQGVIKEIPNYVLPVPTQIEIDEGYIHAFMNSLIVHWAQCLKSKQTFKVFFRDFEAVQCLPEVKITSKKLSEDRQNKIEGGLKDAVKLEVRDAIKNGRMLDEIKDYAKIVCEDTPVMEVYVERKYAKYIADDFLRNFEKHETVIFDLRSKLHNIFNVKDINEPFKKIKGYELLRKTEDSLDSKNMFRFIKRFRDICLRKSMPLKSTVSDERDFLQELQKQILRIYQNLSTSCTYLEQCLKSAMEIPIDTLRVKHFLWKLSRPRDNSFSKLRKLAENILKTCSQILVQFVHSIIIKFNQGITINFQTENGLNVLKCEGLLVDMQTINTEVEKKRSLFEECSQVEVQADFYFLLNCSVLWQGKNVIVVTNRFIVSEINDNFTIDVSGKHGTIANKKAENGTESFVDGLAGEPGIHGESGGNVFIIADKFSNKSRMTILSNGGNGSNGQEGGDGSNGIDGVDGKEISEADFTERFPDMAEFWASTVQTNFKAFEGKNKVSKTKEYASGYFKNENTALTSKYYVKGVTDDNHMIEYGCWYNHAVLSWTMLVGFTNRSSYCIAFGQPGSNGTPGGNGGKGGHGGKRGFEGKVDITDWNGKQIPAIEIRCYEGQCGSEGKDGSGGKGGKNGKNGNDRVHICPGQTKATRVYTGYLKIVSYDRSSNLRSYCPNRKKYIGVTQKALEYPSLQRCPDGLNGENRTRVNNRNSERSRTKKTPIVFSKVKKKHRTIDFKNAYHSQSAESLRTSHMNADEQSETRDIKIIKGVEEPDQTTYNFNPLKAVHSEKNKKINYVPLGLTLTCEKKTELMKTIASVMEEIKKGPDIEILEKDLCSVFDSLDQIKIHKSFDQDLYVHFLEFTSCVKANCSTWTNKIDKWHEKIMVNFKFYVLETIDNRIKQYIECTTVARDTLKLVKIRLKGFYEQLISDVMCLDDVSSLLNLIEIENEKNLDNLIEKTTKFVGTIPLFQRIPGELALDMTDFQALIADIYLSDLQGLSSDEKAEISELITFVCQSSVITETPLTGYTKNTNIYQQMEEVKEKVAKIQISLLRISGLPFNTFIQKMEEVKEKVDEIQLFLFRALGKRCTDPYTYHQLTKTCQTPNTETNAADILLSNIASLGLKYGTATPGNGDCFFEAISDQLIRLDRPHESADRLRKNVVIFCRKQPILQSADEWIDLKTFVDGSDLEFYLNKMSKKGEWADNVIVIAMAAYLQAEIRIITSNVNEDDGNIIYINTWDLTQDVFFLGHLPKNHYQALTPCVKEIPGIRKKKSIYRAAQVQAVPDMTSQAAESASNTDTTLSSSGPQTRKIITKANRINLSNEYDLQKGVDVSEHGKEEDSDSEDLIDDNYFHIDINDLLEWAQTNLKTYKDEVCCIIQKIRYIQDETVLLFIRCLTQKMISQDCQVREECLYWFLLGIFENEKYVDRWEYLRIIATKNQEEWITASIIHKIVSRSEPSHEVRYRELINMIPVKSVHLFLCKYLSKVEDGKVIPKEKIEFILGTLQNLSDDVSDICLAEFEESDIHKWPTIIKWYKNIKALKDLSFSWQEDSNLFEAAYITFQLADRHGDTFIDKIYQCLKSYHIEETLFLSSVKRLYSGSLTIDLSEIEKVKSSSDANYLFGNRTPGCCTDDRKIEHIFSIMETAGNSTLNDSIKKTFEDIDATLSNKSLVLRSSEQKTVGSFLSTLTESDIKEWSIKCKNILISEPARFQDLLPEIVLVIDRAIQLKRQYCLRDVQKVSIIAFLAKSNASDKGKLQQISTGEGKTLIIVAFSIIKVLSNEKVDIITSSSVLAKRDSRINNDVFDLFNVSVSNNCSEIINDRREAYSSDVVYGEIGSFQRDILITEFYDNNIIGGRNRINIVVDEVDSMLLDRGENVLYLSHEIAGIDAIEFVFVYIWSLVNAKHMIGTDEDRRSVRRCILDAMYGLISNEDIQNCSPVGSNINAGEIWKILTRKDIVNNEGRLLTRSLAYFETLEDNDIDILRSSNLAGNLINMLKDAVRKGNLIKVPHFLEEFINRHLNAWIKNAFQAKYMEEGKDFMIDIDRTESGRGEDVNIVIMDNKTGQELYQMQWNCGLHQFLQLKYKCAISSVSLKAVFMSNISFFRLYENLYGLSGTLGSEKERNLLREMYNTSFISIPTFREPQFVEDKTIVCISTDCWLKSISETAISLYEKRPVLIICETIHSCCKIEKEFKRRGLNPYVYKNSYCELFVLNSELNSGCIIIATNLAGRGTDFRINETLETYGGLHVILSYLPSNIRIEEQAFGRAARKGQKGSGQLIILNNVNSKYKTKDVSTISMLKVERDTSEIKRISKIQQRYENYIQVEESLFKEFQKYYDVLRRTLNKNKVDKEFQKVILQALLDRWAFWLDSADISLNHLGTHPTINYILSQFLKKIDVSAVPHDCSNMMLMLQSPSLLVNAGKAKMLTKEYGMAKQFFDYVIHNYPSFSESALYYKAYCLLKIGDHDQDYAVVKSTLAHCSFLLRQREEDLRNEVQIVNYISSKYTDGRHSLTLSSGFKQQKDNVIQIFYQIIDSIENIIGLTIEPNMFVDTTFNLFNANMIFKDLETDNILSPQKVRLFPLDVYSWNTIKSCYELYSPEIRTRIEQLEKMDRVYINDFADILPSREEFWRILTEKGILSDKKDFILLHEGELQRCNNFLPNFVIDSLQSLKSNKEILDLKEYIFLYAEQREKIIAQTSIMVPLETFKKIVGYSFILNILQKENIISQCSVAVLSLNDECELTQLTLQKFDHMELKSFTEIGVTEEISCKIYNQLVKMKVISQNGKLLTHELGNVWLSPLSKYTTEVRNVLTKCFKYRLCLLYLLREKELPLDLLSKTHELLFRDLVDANIITSAEIKSHTANKSTNEKHEVIYDFENKTNQFPRILESELIHLCINADFSAEKLKQKLIQNGLCKKCKLNSEECLEIIVKYETLAEMLQEQKLKDLGNEVTCFVANRIHNSLNISSILVHLERLKTGFYKFENTDAKLKSLAECLTEEDQTVLYKDILTLTNNGFGDIIVLVERKWTLKTVFRVFCILSIGFIQVGIAIAVEYFSVEKGTFIANALLSEGIGDIIFAVECMIAGHCTMHSYLTHKKLSLSLVAVTGGVANIVARGAAFSRFGYKTCRQFFQGHSKRDLIKAGVSKTLLAKSIAKYIGKKIVAVTSMKTIDKGIDYYIKNILRRCLVELIYNKMNIIVSTDKYDELKVIIASLAKKSSSKKAMDIIEKCMAKCLRFRESDSSAVLIGFKEIAHAFGNGLREGLEKLQYTDNSKNSWLDHTVEICGLLTKGIEVTKAGIDIQSFKTSILDSFEHEINTAFSFRRDMEDDNDEGELDEGWASEQLNNVVKKANSEINKYFEMQIESIIIQPLHQLVVSKMSKQIYKRVCQLGRHRGNLCQRRTFDSLKKEIRMKHISTEMDDNVKIEYSKKLLKLLKETRNPSLFADIVEEGIALDIHSAQAVAEITGVSIDIETVEADAVTMKQKFTPYGNQRGEEITTIKLKHHFNTETGASHFETVSSSENQLHTSKCLLEAAMNLTGKGSDRKVLSETIRTHPDICRNIKRGLREFFHFQSDVSCVLAETPEPLEIIEKGHLLSNCTQMRNDKIFMELHKRNLSVTLKNKNQILKELKSHPSSEDLKIHIQIKSLESFFKSISQKTKRSLDSKHTTELLNASLYVIKIANTCIDTSRKYVNPTEIYFGNKLEYVDNLQVFYNCRIDTRFVLSNNRGMIWGHPNALQSKRQINSTLGLLCSNQQLTFKSYHMGVLIGGKREIPRLSNNKVWEDNGDHLLCILNGLHVHVQMLPSKTQLQEIDLSNWNSGIEHDLAIHNCSVDGSCLIYIWPI